LRYTLDSLIALDLLVSYIEYYIVWMMPPLAPSFE